MNKELYYSADISADGIFRHSLCRRWDYFYMRTKLTYIMLNPSTADHQKDDPTIRKCIHYAKQAKFNGFNVVNLFDYRATDPQNLRKAGYPVSGHNAAAVEIAMLNSDVVVCAWGAHANRPEVRLAADVVVDFSRRRRLQLYCLGLTKDGHPRHPLMLRNDQPILPWKGY